jgi:RES domain-containing protein
MLIYRLGSGRYPPNDGLGASLYGGRWNHKGTPVIYGVASRALCALEILANANELAGDYVATPIELPDDLAVITLSIDSLPSDGTLLEQLPALPISAQNGQRGWKP